MKNSFPSTPQEIDKWLKWYLGSHITEPQMHGQIQSLKRHDIWNAYLYGDTVKVVYINTAPPVQKPDKKKPRFAACEASAEERFKQSLTRSRSRVYELAMCNEFQHFATFTLDKTKRDRYDLAGFRKAFAQYVRNLNRDRSEEQKIKYVVIPENHKDGAWHMHGLMQGLTAEDLRAFRVSERIPERIKAQIRAGTPVYDWGGYSSRFGYFTATEIKDKTAVSKYITKYLTKDMSAAAREAGEHLFFASQGLKGRECVAHNRYEQCPVDKWDYESQYVKIAEYKIEAAPPELLLALFGG